MGNAVTGSYRSTTALVMAAFDRLPPDVRAALRDAVDNWVPQPLATRRKQGWEDKQLVALVWDWNRSELRQREQQRRSATGRYKGNRPDPDYVPRKRRRRGRR
jgi:hypothetical protein